MIKTTAVIELQLLSIPTSLQHQTSLWYLSKVPVHGRDVVSTSFVDDSLLVHHVLLPFLLVREKHGVVFTDG